MLQDPWPDQGPNFGGPGFRRMVEQEVPGRADAFLAMSEKLGITPIWVSNIVQENRPDQWELVENWSNANGGDLPVQVYELGNEIPHWQTTKDISIYLDRIRPLGQKLKQQHPKTTSAVCAWEPVHLWQPNKGGHPDRAEAKAWNQSLSNAGAFYDGVIMHCCLNSRRCLALRRAHRPRARVAGAGQSGWIAHARPRPASRLSGTPHGRVFPTARRPTRGGGCFPPRCPAPCSKIASRKQAPQAGPEAPRRSGSRG